MDSRKEVFCLVYCSICIHMTPSSESRKFSYADDMAYAFQHRSFSEINKNMTRDMVVFVRYCKLWRLIPNVSKTIVSCFHLTNQAANLELSVIFNGVKLHHEFEPVYLGVKLYRSLTYKSHIDKLRAKLSTRNNLLQKLTGTSWGANDVCLHTTALALICSCGEYCCSTWRVPAAIETAKELLAYGFNLQIAWKRTWLYTGATGQLHNPKEFSLKRKAWCNLNRLRTGHGNCNCMLHKWNFTDDPSCTCGNPRQSTNHLHCYTVRSSNTTKWLTISSNWPIRL